ncbi:hypothetical protein CM240_0225 [Clostridium bornimense]|uniref:PoNi C-terminal domain-containing protein n=1 Tax=Clostridium bornimense TaxID=1216932 RepID=W6SCT6_9CLOT|nr:PoNi-like cognate immunity protein [Clostridium bornimense]CDM67395.1 hypothetical protein CM240_0225 [Clostridium bornimense]
MRDNIKDINYFKKKYQSENNRIEKFKNAILELDKTNVNGIKIGKIHLSNLYMNCVKLTYSMGYSCDKVFEYYVEYLKYYTDVCLSNDSIYDIIDILSIGVLFIKKKNIFIEYLRRIMKDSFIEDGLIICLFQYLENGKIQKERSQFDYFNDLCVTNEKEMVLINELNKWYHEHYDAYWYNSHKSVNDTYCGYWCFEVAALAKIFNVDDTCLKSNKFYPYDLAHYELI